MAFRPVWTDEANAAYQDLKHKAEQSRKRRHKAAQRKSSQPEGLFKQVHKCISLLLANPRHPGLQTHPYDSLDHPYDGSQKVFEAYAQNRTPGAYRVFWCYGPKNGEITLIAITPHP